MTNQEIVERIIRERSRGKKSIYEFITSWLIIKGLISIKNGHVEVTNGNGVEFKLRKVAMDWNITLQ